MTSDEVNIPDGFTLVGWIGRDQTKTATFPACPTVRMGAVPIMPRDFMMDIFGGSCMDPLIKAVEGHLPLLHAVPVYINLGEMKDLTPIPPVEWVTAGVNSVAMCEGYSLSARKTGFGHYAEARASDGAFCDQRNDFATLPAAQAWAVSKARELARTAKGVK